MLWMKRRPSERAEIIENTLTGMRRLSDKIEDYVDDASHWAVIDDIIQGFYERGYTMKARLVGTDDAHRIPEFDKLIQHVDQMLEERRLCYEA